MDGSVEGKLEVGWPWGRRWVVWSCAGGAPSKMVAKGSGGGGKNDRQTDRKKERKEEKWVVVPWVYIRATFRENYILVSVWGYFRPR